MTKHKLTPALILLFVGLLIYAGLVFLQWYMGRPLPVEQLPVPVASKPADLTTDLTDLAARVNSTRQANNLPALSRSPALDASAADKCRDMQTSGYFAHVSPGGRSYADFIFAHSPKLTAGENLADRASLADTILTAWLNSPGHRENILKPAYTEAGYASCEVPGHGTVTVQHFAG